MQEKERRTSDKASLREDGKGGLVSCFPCPWRKNGGTIQTCPGGGQPGEAGEAGFHKSTSQPGTCNNTQGSMKSPG